MLPGVGRQPTSQLCTRSGYVRDFAIALLPNCTELKGEEIVSRHCRMMNSVNLVSYINRQLLSCVRALGHEKIAKYNGSVLPFLSLVESS